MGQKLLRQYKEYTFPNGVTKPIRRGLWKIVEEAGAREATIKEILSAAQKHRLLYGKKLTTKRKVNPRANTRK